MAEFSNTGSVWVLRLDNNETQGLNGLLASGGGPICVASGPMCPLVMAALGGAVGYILAINKFGGNRGVDVNGAIGAKGIIVTPRTSGMYEKLIQASRVAVSGRTIADFVLRAASSVPALQQALEIPVAAELSRLILSGTPFGWAMAGALGAAINILAPEPNPNEHGGIHADRGAVGAWEKFTMSQLGVGNNVALLSHMGFFSAMNGGGDEVFANRPEVLAWETWTLFDNNDGTVSFRAVDNVHFLAAMNGGGAECRCRFNGIGPWERFRIENLPGGQIALRTFLQNQYVSVQHGV